MKDLKGTTEKTESLARRSQKNGKTEKKDSFHLMILKKIGYAELKVPNFRKFSDISVVKNNQGFEGFESTFL